MKKAALWLGAAGVVAGVAMSRPASAAEMFADVPTDHWAYQAVNNLQERGIVIGYPDGTFGGKRAMTRYEFAVAIDRLIDWVNRSIATAIDNIPDQPNVPPGVTEERVRELIEERVRNLPTREDLETIRRLVEEFRDELAALGTNVEALRRDVDALKARVGAIEERLNRWSFTGEANFIVRGENADEETIPGFGTARRGVFDIDSRTDNNPTSNILEQVKTLYSLDFGIIGRFGNGVTANALLNVGNYLPWASSNRQNPGVDATRGNAIGGLAADVSTVPEPAGVQGVGGPGAPLGSALSTRPITQGNFGKEAINTSFSEITPLKLFLNSPVRDLWFLKDIDATVGKFGVQFTPYTLRQVDPDTYTNVTLTDNGEIIATGGMARARIGGLHMTGYSATHYNGRSVNTGYPVFISWGGPHVLSAMDYGALPLDQSSGVRGTLKLGRFDLGGTYITAGIRPTLNDPNSPFASLPYSNRPNENNEGRRMIPRRGQVLGADVRFPLFGRLGVAGEFAESNTLAGVQVGERDGVYPSQLRYAYDAKLTYGAGRLSLAGGYKQVDPFFGAPGSWGRIGRWKNPTNIQGVNASAGYNFGNFTLKGSWADYESVRVDLRNSRLAPGTPGGAPIGGAGAAFPVFSDDFQNEIKHYTVGVSFDLNPSNGIDLGWEQARIRPFDAAGANVAGIFGNGETRETYWTIGLGHRFNESTLIKVMYQIVDYEDNGAGLYTVPGGNYKGGIGVTQLTVRF